MNLRRIIREEMDDSLQWMQDIQTNQDIAQEIADKTELKNNRIYSPFFPSIYIPSLSLPRLSLSLSLALSSFFSYCKEQYGLSEDDIDDVWERYKNIIKDKMLPPKEDLNESDFEWVDEDLIKVGNCFTIKDNMGKLFPRHWNIKIKVTEMEVPTNVEEWDNLQLKNRTNVYFTGTSTSLKFKLTYQEVEQWINRDAMIPTECK